VLFLDLDHFKLINDSMGHSAGDVLLVDVAIRLRQAVPVGSILGRFGGDEFLVVVPHLASEQRMALLGATIALDFTEPFVVDGRHITMTASIGAALSRADSTAAALMQEADVALSEAKRGNRGTYQLFDLSMASIAVRRLIVETELREALAAN
jgi:diguanylate cyclase (GGDEF)-like protein